MVVQGLIISSFKGLFRVKRIQGFQGSRVQVKYRNARKIFREKHWNPGPLMFLALHLTPGILDPLTPDVFTHSFRDDPKI